MIQFSIIVPVYNTGTLLKRCLNSLLQQGGSYHDYEVIVVNDGSTDEITLGILNIYERLHEIIRIIHRENGGGLAARREGIKFACGKFITFVDSDDAVTNDYIYVLHEAVIHKAEMYILNNYLQHEEQDDAWVEKSLPNTGYVTSKWLWKQLLSVRMNAIWDKIYRRDFFEPLEDVLPKNIMYGDDMYLNNRYLSSQHPVKNIYVQNSLVYYHFLDTAVSVSSNTKNVRQRVDDTIVCLESVDDVRRSHPELGASVEKMKDFCYGYIYRYTKKIDVSSSKMDVSVEALARLQQTQPCQAKSLKGFLYRLLLQHKLRH